MGRGSSLPYQGSNKHGYGELAPDSNEEIRQMVLQNNKEVFVKDLAHFIRDLWGNKHDRYPQTFSTKASKEKSVKKAKELIEGEKKTDIPPKINFEKGEHWELIKKAELEGYLQNFYIDIPWHVKPFLARNFVSFPYQHNKAILYTAVNKAVFFNEMGTPSGMRNQKSALKVGHILGRTGDDGSHINMQELTSTDEANWLGFPNNAVYFANQISSTKAYEGGGIVLEVEISTNELETIVAPKKARQKKKGVTHGTIHLSNLKELKREFTEDKFETPLQAFHHYCEVSRNIDGIKNVRDSEIVHFAVQHEIMIDDIIGVWDYDFSEKPLFEDFGAYIKRLKAQESEKMPGGLKEDRIKVEIKEEINHLEELYSSIEKINKQVNNLLRFGDRENQWRRYSKNYNKQVNKLEKLVKEDFGVKLNLKDKMRPSRSDLLNLENEIGSISNEIKQIINKEKKRAIKNDWNKEKYKKEKEYENKVNKIILEDISKIPRSLDRKIDKIN